MKRLVGWTILAALAAGGCGGQSMDQWFKEKLVPEPTVAKVPRIESAKPDERREALQAVAADAGARQSANVIKLYCLVATTDKDPMVRSAAVRGLGDMQGEGILAALGLVLEKDESPYVRMDAAASLGRRGNPEGIPDLAKAVAKDPQSDVRAAAAEALRYFKDKAAGQVLVKALSDPSLAVEQKAWESLRYMTGQNIPRMAQPWEDFFVASEHPFEAYGKPPPMPEGQNQRPKFRKGPLEFIQGLFAKDVREQELE